MAVLLGTPAARAAMHALLLQLPPSDWLASNELAFAVRAPSPICSGHVMVAVRRPVASYADTTAPERVALWALVDEVERLLDPAASREPCQVSFSAGRLADDATPEAAVHVIPRAPRAMPAVEHRRPGSSAPGALTHSPRARPLATGGDLDPLARHLWPLFANGGEIAIVAAFVTETGLALLEPWVLAARRAGARLRFVTGDYLTFNQVDALRQLLGWSQLDVHTELETGEARHGGPLRVRIVETTQPDGSERAFHPKTWLFESESAGVAFVGSSNVSRSALETGIEWNLRVERAIDPIAYASVRSAVDTLWAAARELTPEWIEAYTRRVQQSPRPLPPGDGDAELLEPPPEPHEIQREALAALARAREQGRRRALVVLATGLGKTWLAAFDVAQLAEVTDAWPRVLFLAHREELLAQAARTFRRVLLAAAQPADVGWCAGDLMQLDAPVVVASIQKLCRPDNLDRLAAEHFDYVVVDEVHHADAPTYRRVLGRLDPSFLLGLTATPDRADARDILGLFDDFVAHRADLGLGIQRGRLVPFAYHGVRDDIDYEHIPWKNRRFDPTALAAAAQTQQRMETLWGAWQQHPGTRTLVFCCSVAHARFTRRWLAERGVRVDAVFSGAGSGDRSDCVAQLARGELDALCVVDLFNEGVDIPALDRVVMLRPTESPVVFLQQLGRGLRRHEGKQHLTVIDFVGNHQLFCGRIRRLLSLVSSPTSLREYLKSSTPPELPPGCSIDLELELKELLQTFLPRGALEVERVYRELVLARGERPSLGELYRMGYRPSTLRRAHDSWFRFVAQEGHLDTEETRALDSLSAWFETLETSRLGPLELIVLEVLLESDALTKGLAIDELAQRSHAFLMSEPALLRALDGVAELGDPRNPDPAAWRAFWLATPVATWTSSPSWFAVEGDHLVPRRLAIPTGLENAAARMTRELVDYRLEFCRSRTSQDLAGDSFSCVVTWNQRNPILKLPSRDAVPSVPSGSVDVRLPDGAVWTFRFASQYCNVAMPVATDRNRLPDLMRQWFGPNAGHPGTRFQVQFSRSPDGWWIEPLGSTPALSPRAQLVAYPSLRAAAGAIADARPDEPERELVSLPFEGVTEDLFAVRAAGDSMNGGKDPIADGDWLIMRWARGDGLAAMVDRVALIQTPDSHGTFAYQVKRIVHDGQRWTLHSDNPEHTPVQATTETIPIARLVTRFAPETLAPAVGEWLTRDTLSGAFGLPAETSIERTGRHAGHLFILVNELGLFTEPDRLTTGIGDRRPAETAFVLARPTAKDRWRYCGVGRWLENEQQWRVPPLDFDTWRALGRGRDCSHRLPAEAKTRANALVDDLFRRTGPGAWLVHHGKRCRVLERTPGGVRIDGGEDGFAPRRVSVTDIAWVLLAADDVAANGGVLDEARVNRLRYLEGTPKGSTRWIDTGWAIAMVGSARDRT